MESIIIGVISSATLAVCAWLGKQLLSIKVDFTELKVSQRHQIKAQIVSTYERAKDRGYITPLELETCCRMFESYEKLGGNTYVKTLMERLENELEIKGENVPEH